MASVIKLPTHLWDCFSHAMNKAAQPVLGKFPIKVYISMTISNSVYNYSAHISGRIQSEFMRPEMWAQWLISSALLADFT
jgi:hypothetical protein